MPKPAKSSPPPNKKGANARNGATVQNERATDSPRLSFANYIWKSPEHRKMLRNALIIFVVGIILYKFAIGEADYTSDSHAYVGAALSDQKTMYRPFGFSRFLQVLHYFSSSSWFVVFVQYILCGLSSLFCFFSVDFLFGFKNKAIKHWSFYILVANPIFLVMANFMGSDMIFIAFTVAWFASILWIIKRPAVWALCLQVLFLYWAFNVRYTAMYYPIIAIAAFLLAYKAKPLYKLAGIVFSLLVVFVSYQSIKNTTNEDTGAEVFSGFSGWQMANNALYIYPNAVIDSNDFETPEVKTLDRVIRMSYNQIGDTMVRDIKDGRALGAYFLWGTKSPLKMYLYYYCRQNQVSYIVGWYQISPYMNEYGTTVIKNNKMAFLKYYVWPNVINYFLPDGELLAAYELNTSPISAESKQWFGIKSDKPKVAYAGLQKIIGKPFPLLNLLLSLFCFIMPAVYFFKEKAKHKAWKADYVVPVLIWYTFFIINFLFSLVTSVIVLRYNLVWFILGLTLPVWFLDQIITQKKQIK